MSESYPQSMAQIGHQGKVTFGPESSLQSASIVIPVYNRAHLLADCLKSLQHAVAAGAEVIVVDDGSSDGTVAAARAFAETLPAGAVRVIEQANAGPGAARNTGVAASSRDWIVFVDSDDLWLPWSAQTLSRVIADTDAGAVFFATRGFASGSPPKDWARADDDITRHAGFFAMQATVRTGVIGAGCLAIRREVMDRLGGFLPQARGAEDTDLFYRLDGMAPVLRIDAPVMVAAREDNDDSLTRSMHAVVEGLDLLLRRQREGRYPSPAARGALADALQFWLRSLFNAGYGRTAYRLLFRDGGLSVLLAEGRRKAALRLLAHPLLSILRPRNYAFGWGPPLVSARNVP